MGIILLHSFYADLFIDWCNEFFYIIGNIKQLYLQVYLLEEEGFPLGSYIFFSAAEFFHRSHVSSSFEFEFFLKSLLCLEDLRDWIA